MTAPTSDAPRLLVVGGCGGLVGRAVLGEFARDHRLRSVHRHPDPAERAAGVEFVPGDVGTIADWGPLVDGVDTVLPLTWYRPGRHPGFAPVSESLRRLVGAAERAAVRRFVQVSVPAAPPGLESGLPYLAERRLVDRAIEASGLDYAIVRPTMLFGRGDRLATVMLRTAARYGRLPMFGDGNYHLSPLSTRDLARVLRREGARGGRRTITVGGPASYSYRALCEAVFRAVGRRPRYLSLSPTNGVRLARLLERLGSTLIYPYEVEWLVSDTLGAPAYDCLDAPMDRIEPFLEAEANRRRADPPAPGGAGT